IHIFIYTSTCTDYITTFIFIFSVAKQCLESAFNFSADDQTSVPDLFTIFEKSSTPPLAEPSEEAKSMAETLKNQGSICSFDYFPFRKPLYERGQVRRSACLLHKGHRAIAELRCLLLQSVNIHLSNSCTGYMNLLTSAATILSKISFT
ncbi:hypothetical protein AHF37_01073, partial [Paragonimus kellicotti]